MDGDECEVWTVKVFREHERWGDCELWFMMPAHLLNELYVCTYEVRRDCRPTEASKCIRWIRKEHPDCVLVY
jgi:hypothetical protein